MPSEREIRNLYVNGRTICIEVFFCFLKFFSVRRTRSRHRMGTILGAWGDPSTRILAGAIRLKSQNMYMFALLAHLYKTYFISLRYSRGNNPVTRWNCFAKLSGRSYPTACAISAMLNSVPIRRCWACPILFCKI